MVEGDMTKFKVGRLFEVAIAKPTLGEIAALVIIIAFLTFLIWR